MKKKKVKNNSSAEKIVHELTLIRNSAFCSYTLPRARRLLKKIQSDLLPEEYMTILNYIDNIDVDNPDVWQPEWARTGDYKSQLMYVRGEFSAYIGKLIDKKKVGDLVIC